MLVLTLVGGTTADYEIPCMLISTLRRGAAGSRHKFRPLATWPTVERGGKCFASDTLIRYVFDGFELMPYGFAISLGDVRSQPWPVFALCTPYGFVLLHYCLKTKVAHGSAE